MQTFILKPSVTIGMKLTTEQKKLLSKIVENELAEATGRILMYPSSVKYYTERKKQLVAISKAVASIETQ